MRTLTSLGALMLFALACGAFAADAPDPGLAKPGWNLVFHDEFDGTPADLDKNWEFQNGPSTHILSSRWRENVVLENGLCRLLNKKEKRGGQDWTSASMWTQKQFKYGYFECRYRYGNATGLNNSFWIMTRGNKDKEDGLFEIDINEGHIPNEVNTNIHKWSGEHQAKSRDFRIGAEPGQTFEFETPVEASKLRLTIRDHEKARIQELRVFAPSKAGYPPVLPAEQAVPQGAKKAAKGAKAGKGANGAKGAKGTQGGGKAPARVAAQPAAKAPAKPAIQAVNLALGAKATASSAMAEFPATKAVDGLLGTPSRWVTEAGTGPHTLIVDLGKLQTIGCIQLVSGYQTGKEWIGMATDFSIDVWNGERWVELVRSAGADVDLAKEFHVYGLEWNEKELVYSFDGKVLRRAPNEWCHREAPVWLSEAIIKWAGEVGDNINGTSMDVDYVRVYQRAEGSKASAAAGKAMPDDLNLGAMLRPAPGLSKLVDPNYYIWCGSMVRDDMGRCHLFYSRWPRALGHNAWVTSSEVAHAVSDDPAGPYRHVDIALPARGKEFWDGLCTHNPTVYNFKGKYYLYYMGNTGDGKLMKTLNYTHRNNQRIGVAVADSPNGPWRRFDKPVIDVSPDKNAPDALMASNPAVCRRPDGTFLMIYKGVGLKLPLPSGGPVVHCIATGPTPTGPFTKTGRLAFTVPGDKFPAEDPFIWYQSDRSRYYAVVKDNNGAFTKQGYSLALFTSEDGLDWRPAAHPLVSLPQVMWVGNRLQKLTHLERPQLWFADDGSPALLLAAADEDKERTHSFNVQIPLGLE